jgi:hypothetical protein
VLSDEVAPFFSTQQRKSSGFLSVPAPNGEQTLEQKTICSKYPYIKFVPLARFFFLFEVVPEHWETI